MQSLAGDLRITSSSVALGGMRLGVTQEVCALQVCLAVCCGWIHAAPAVVCRPFMEMHNLLVLSDLPKSARGHAADLARALLL